MDEQPSKEIDETTSPQVKKLRKCYLRSHGQVPRQTLYNWRRKALARENSSMRRQKIRKATRDSRPKEVQVEENLNEELPGPNFDDFVFPEQDNASTAEGKPLFSTSALTVGHSVFLILSFFIKHSLNKQALQGLLNLISLLLPKPNNFPRSIYFLNKLVSDITQNYVVRKHFYCENCSTYLNSTSTHQVQNVCDNCNKTQSSPGVFVELPVDSVIKTLFEDRGMFKFYDNPSPPKTETGLKYKELKDNVLTDKYDVIIAWNTDGVPVFKSSDQQLWPLQITILDLPPLVRQCYVSVIGLWIGSSKPNMNTFLKPFCESLTTLFSKGFSWVHPITKLEITSKILAPLVVLDAPARALVLNMNQFNGKHGCVSCTNKGEVVLRGKGRARIYKGVDFTCRTNERIKQHADRAVEVGVPVFGIKGPTWVSAIPFLDLSKSFSPDYMHCVLLGVVRHFLFQWLDTANHKEKWYIGDKVSLLDKKLLSVKPPSFIQRLPRSLTKRKLWKASEFRSWLLFYSIPVLNGILLDKYLQHWIILVYCIFTLLKTNVSQREIDLAEVLLKMFVIDIPELYHENVSSTFNSHQLLHLCSFTRNWGPLWVSSAFNFESNNGVLLRMIHGSNSVSAQLVNTLRLMNGMWFLSSKYKSQLDSSCIVVLGLDLKSPLPPSLLQNSVFRVLKSYMDNGYLVFQRLKRFKEVYTSKVYKRQTKYNNFTVMISGRFKFGAIECFLKREDASAIYCVIRAFHVNDSQYFNHKSTNTPIQHLIPVTESNIVFIVNFDKVLEKVIVVNNCLALRPNKVENLL